MKWVCVCAHWNWCKSFRWPQQGWASLFPCAAVLHRPHPGPGEGPRSISVPSAQKDVDLRRRGGLEHFRLLETSSPSPASSEAYERHHQWHAANYWCVMVEAWPTPRGGSPDARTSPGWNRCSRAKSCWSQAPLTSSSCWGGTTLLHLPLAWHLLEVFFPTVNMGVWIKNAASGTII